VCGICVDVGIFHLDLVALYVVVSRTKHSRPPWVGSRLDLRDQFDFRGLLWVKFWSIDWGSNRLGLLGLNRWIHDPTKLKRESKLRANCINQGI
jgi:hypothetical protein